MYVIPKDLVIPFLNMKGHIALYHYQNNRVAICLEDVDDGEPIMTCTVNMPEIPLEKDEVIIKDYSENEGIYDILLNAKVIEATGKTANNGYVVCPIAKIILPKAS